MRKLSKVKGLLEFSLWRIKAQKEQLVLLFGFFFSPLEIQKYWVSNCIFGR